MAAVVGILNESLTEAIRGFYKVRKAFVALDHLYNLELKYAKKNANSTRQSSVSMASNGSVATAPGRPADTGTPSHPSVTANPPVATLSDANIKEDEKSVLVDAKADDAENHPPEDQGNLDVTDVKEDQPNGLISNGTISRPSTEKQAPTRPSASSNQILDIHPDSPVFSNPLDTFIHSGVNLWFGLLLLLISMIPPTFSRLLSIIGFRGDKRKGMLLLWQASRFHNVHGAMAALGLLGWYNALVGVCDIVPDPPTDSTPETQIEGYPTYRLRTLLSVMASRYPKSQLWQLEKARMAASSRDLSTALTILNQPCTSPLKQIAAIQMFERAMNAMYAHDYALSASSFLTCVDLNSWSKSLYYYNAGANHLALYRKLRTTDPKAAAPHAQEAESHFRTAPTFTGKKKIVGKQLPFDLFVARKIQKWDQRSRDFGIAFIDAVGVAPTEEISFLWNGYRKKNRAQLEQSLTMLSYSDDNTNTNTNAAHPNHPGSKKEESTDEKALLAVLRAAILRNLRRHDEAKAQLHDHVLSRARFEFKGGLRDDWVAPVAHYELAVNLWMQRSAYIAEHGAQLVEHQTSPDHNNNNSSDINNAGPVTVDVEKDRKLVKQCKEHILTVKGWDSFQLDNRIGLKVTSALEAVGRWEERFGAV